MPTTYASIGNSDDRLAQARWSQFHAAFAQTVRDYARVVHGSWLSGPADPWQNACIAFEVGAPDAAALKRALRILAAEYAQDSIAWAETDETEFLKPGTDPAPS